MRALLLTLLLVAGCTAAAQTQSTHVVLDTNKGVIEIALYNATAPQTVSNFLRYVDEGFYDGTIFHRVIPGFVIQGGGYTAEGVKKGTHAPIALEAGDKNLRGTIAMARTTDPNSATSQFFINLKDNSQLDPAPGNPGYAVFGKVVKGMDVVDAIAQVPTGSHGDHQDWPTTPVVIEHAYVKK